MTSGIVGGLISVFIIGWLVKWMPLSYAGKSRETLLMEYRLAIWLSNIAFVGGLIVGWALYDWSGYANKDLRPLGFGFGIALVAPTVILPVVAFLRRGKASEAFVAYSFSQGIPPAVLLPLLLLGWPVLLYTLTEM